MKTATSYRPLDLLCFAAGKNLQWKCENVVRVHCVRAVNVSETELPFHGEIIANSRVSCLFAETAVSWRFERRIWDLWQSVVETEQSNVKTVWSRAVSIPIPKESWVRFLDSLQKYIWNLNQNWNQKGIWKGIALKFINNNFMNYQK